MHSKQLFGISGVLRVQNIFLSVLLIFVSVGCGKSDNTIVKVTAARKLSAIYKDTLPGIWTWQHIYYIYNSNVPYTYVKVADTTFPILIVNDSDISVLGNSLRYYDSVFYSGNIGRLNDTANNLRYSNKFALPQIIKYLSFSRKDDSVLFESSYEYGIGGQKGDIYSAKIVH